MNHRDLNQIISVGPFLFPTSCFEAIGIWLLILVSFGFVLFSVFSVVLTFDMKTNILSTSFENCIRVSVALDLFYCFIEIFIFDFFFPGDRCPTC